MRAAVALLALLLGCATLAGCDGSSSDDADTGHTTVSTATATATAAAAAAAASGVPVGTATTAPVPDARQQTDAQNHAFDAAVSTPAQDSVYPDVGSPTVDALHYGLDLAWTPSTRTLSGTATVVFRAPADESRVQLDLSAALRVTSVTLDGQPATYGHPGKDLLVDATVARDSRHVLEIRYSGTPLPAAAPTIRPDVATVGWTTGADGSAWTMQEPYGAYTWYPVDDQPADKAFYDITLTTVAPFVGVANGEQTTSTTHGGLTTTSWKLDSPAASYLVTLAVGDYEKATGTSPQTRVPITYWVPEDQQELVQPLKQAASALDWVESKLGTYPFSTLGFVVVDSTSGMETQTMITLGDARYDVSAPVLVHELVHQWYGDEVTPSDWSDLWMNEGMAMYLQLVWQAEHDGKTMTEELTPVVRDEARLRAEDGPPAAYDPSTFAEANAYYGPALMWQALRQRLGDQRFFALIKAWPATHHDSSQTRETFLSWLVQHTGVPRSFFDDWLLSPTSPHLTLQG